MEETIYTLDIKTNVTKSVLDVFDTMLSFQLETVEDAPATDVTEKRIVGSVNFAGQVCGIILIHIQDEFARNMAAAMLGMTIEEIESDEEVRDVICEISNIVGGNLKSFFNDSGFYCVLSTPSITSGENFDITSLNTERYESISYRYQAYNIRVEVGVKLQSGYQADTGGAQEPPKIDTQKIRELNLAAKIPDSVINVFTTMLSMDIQIADAVSKSDLEGMRTVGAVSFAGDAMGIINIHITGQFAREMAAAMLDMTVDEVDGDQDVNDVIGELSNIIGGNLKSIFSDVGLRCELSTPSITRGSDFRIESMNMERYERFAFTLGDHTFFVEFGLKLAEGLNLPAMNGKDINYQVVEEAGAVAPQWPEFTENPETLATEETAPPEIQGPDVPPEPPKEKPPAYAGRTDQQRTAPVQPTSPPSDVNLEFLLDIPLEITIELGRSRMKIKDLLKIKEHSVVELSALADEPVDILVNHKLIAKGEVVVEGGKYGIRVTEILSRAERIKSLSRS